LINIWKSFISAMSRFTDLFQEPAPAPEPESGFNPNARDRDGDGLVQEGTPFERPTPVKASAKKGIK
jgi:hypothetical protein